MKYSIINNLFYFLRKIIISFSHTNLGGNIQSRTKLLCLEINKDQLIMFIVPSLVFWI